LEFFGMAASFHTLHRNYLPLFVIGFTSGLLALIPLVGWLLGLVFFLLAFRYAQRRTFLHDLLVVLGIWLLLQLLLGRLLP
jgi:putative Mn2+ efflux pump MntP